jgi:hypothetical protein
VNPNGGEIFECKFEYGETTAYGMIAPCTPPPGSGTSPVEVHAEVTGLTPNTTYHFRILATNAGGTSLSADTTLKTTLVNPPTVITGAASSVNQTLATLNASVNPNEDLVSKCEFEYGETTAYGKTAPCTPSPGSGTSPVLVSGAITGLTNKTVYHFRISATNAGGTAPGLDRTIRATAPHVYKNGVKMGEGKKLRTIGWGTLLLKNPSLLGEIECHTISAGFSENPTGGGSAIGQGAAFTAYECTAGNCLTLGGKFIEIVPEGLPWTGEITEPEENVFRGRGGNKLQAPGMVKFQVNCEGVTKPSFSGENTPKILNNGLAIGSAPGESEFDQPGSGELESPIAGPGTVTGKVKGEGYAAEELIEVKNP